MFKTILKPFASLTLTVILLVLSMILIYAGTLAQVDTDIWKVQHHYFHSFFARMPLQDLIPRFSKRPAYIDGAIIFPGGYTIGGLLLLNLLAAHSLRFKVSPKDLFLLPLAGVIGGSLYFWQTSYHWLLMAVALAAGTAFLVALFLIHNKRAGVIVIHLGIILLLVGEAITSGTAKEARMNIDQGSYANYALDIREAELAVVDKSAPDADGHVVVPTAMLKPGARLDDPRLPFQVTVDKYFTNSTQVAASLEPSAPSIEGGDGKSWTIREVNNVNGVQSGAVDMPSAFVTLARDGKTLGSYLLTVITTRPQTIDVGGKSYEVSLRFRRDYKPYTITLNKFSFDRYTGTQVAKNFSSDVTLVDADRHERRDVRIWMNHPLRYRGETFYQSSFDDETEKTTILQVVRNPAMTLPYTAIVIAAIGLIVHFGVSLLNFLSRRDLSGAELALWLVLALAAVIIVSIAYVVAGYWGIVIVKGGIGACVVIVLLVRSAGGTANAAARTPAKPTAPAKPGPAKRGRRDDGEGRYELTPESPFFSARFMVPASVLALCLVYVIAHVSPRPLSPTYDFDTFAKIPLSYEGRVQPMDSLARNALKVMRGKESALRVEKDQEGRDVETNVQPIPWLLDSLVRNPNSETLKVIVIDHPDVKSHLGLDEKQKYFSVEDLRPAQEKLDAAFNELSPIRKKNVRPLSEYQAALLEVCDRATLRTAVSAYGYHHVVPPSTPGADWASLAETDRAAAMNGTGQRDPIAEAYLSTLRAYAEGKPNEFNASVRNYQSLLDKKVPKDTTRTTFEAWYNRFDPITMAKVFYVGVFILAAFSWLGLAKPLARAAFWVLALTLVIHTFALVARIYMSGRPPVTNLASSAIFIGWGMVVFAVCLELIFKNGVGSVLAAVAGFPTLFIAAQLSLEGDSMKVLQAVLDTNVWLGSHVVCITLGYAATFLAGLVGIAYVVLGIFTPTVDAEMKKTLSRMMYGITCFAILFSFVGTILGGLWADQSWGRFWGWDPKENGAILIVLANAVFLHARWGGLVKERGMAAIAIGGNIVTAWSYFGTNMLGVGLHSYGFMASAVFWLNLFIVSQVLLILLCAMWPIETWRSFAANANGPTGPAKPKSPAPPSARV